MTRSNQPIPEMCVIAVSHGLVVSVLDQTGVLIAHEEVAGVLAESLEGLGPPEGISIFEGTSSAGNIDDSGDYELGGTFRSLTRDEAQVLAENGGLFGRPDCDKEAGGDCPYCGGNVEFHESSGFIYGGRDFGPVFACSNYPACESYVGLRKGSDPPEPLGDVANPELREARKAARKAFDQIREFCDKTVAYAALAAVLGLKQCIFAQLDLDQCSRVIAIDLRAFMAEVNKLENDILDEQCADPFSAKCIYPDSSW